MTTRRRIPGVLLSIDVPRLQDAVSGDSNKTFTCLLYVYSLGIRLTALLVSSPYVSNCRRSLLVYCLNICIERLVEVAMPCIYILDRISSRVFIIHSRTEGLHVACLWYRLNHNPRVQVTFSMTSSMGHGVWRVQGKGWRKDVMVASVGQSRGRGCEKYKVFDPGQTPRSNRNTGPVTCAVDPVLPDRGQRNHTRGLT